MTSPITSPIMGGHSKLVIIASWLSFLLGIAALILVVPYLISGDASDEGNTAWSWTTLVLAVAVIVATGYYYMNWNSLPVVVIMTVLLLVLGFLLFWTIVAAIVALAIIVLIIVAYTRRHKLIERN